MASDSEEITQFIYSKAVQLLFSGIHEDEVVRHFMDKDVPENIANEIVKKAKEDLIARAKELCPSISENKEKNRLIQLYDSLKEQGNDSISFVDVRELERFSDKESLLSYINPRCIVFCDSRRIDVPRDHASATVTHKHNKAWQRSYEIEGTDLYLKLGLLNTITKDEYDGRDYIEISLQTEDGCIVNKSIFPNGETLLVKVDAQLETSYLKGHINDESLVNDTNVSTGATSSESIITEHAKGSQSIDLTNVSSLVEEWNKLRDSHQELQGDFDVMRICEQVDIQNKMKEIQAGCVAVHMLSGPMRKIHDESDIERLVREYEGKDLTKDLMSYDDNALIVLKGRISGTMANDNNYVINSFFDKFEGAIDTLPEEDSDHIKEFLSRNTLPLICAFYEAAITELLGHLYNVYVAENIRDLFTFSLRQSVMQNHGAELVREDAEILMRNWCEGRKELVSEMARGSAGNVVEIITARGTNMVPGMNQEMYQEFVRIFCNFFLEKRPLVKELVEGRF